MKISAKYYKKKKTIPICTKHLNIKSIHWTTEPPQFHGRVRSKIVLSIDTLDQLVGNYTTKRKTNRWVYALFCSMSDVYIRLVNTCMKYDTGALHAVESNHLKRILKNNPN